MAEINISRVKVDFYFEDEVNNIFFSGSIPVQTPEAEGLDYLKEHIKQSVVDYLNGEYPENPDNLQNQTFNVTDDINGQQAVQNQQNQQNGQNQQTQQIEQVVEQGDVPVQNDGVNSQELQMLGIQELGGGWYQLPNGDKVQGEQTARQRAEQERQQQIQNQQPTGGQIQQTQSPQQQQGGQVQQSGGLTDDQLFRNSQVTQQPNQVQPQTVQTQNGGQQGVQNQNQGQRVGQAQTQQQGGQTGQIQNLNTQTNNDQPRTNQNQQQGGQNQQQNQTNSQNNDGQNQTQTPNVRLR